MGDGISIREEASWLSSFEVCYPPAILRNNSVQDTQQGSPLSLFLPPSNAGIERELGVRVGGILMAEYLVLG